MSERLQELFDHMDAEHGLILLESEMFEIERIVMDSVAIAIHYPDCWDTACYPTLESALSEMYAWFECSNDDCERPTSPAAEKHTESEASDE